MPQDLDGAGPDSDDFRYDEFSYLSENCTEYGLDLPPALAVSRVSVVLGDGRRLSALRWGEEAPAVVLLHGGAQNAHTWDTVALALWPTPILAVDLPGHGHSSWRDDGAYDPRHNADDIAQMIATHAPEASLVVGMSLGGLSAAALAARHPGLVRRLLLVDVTPGVNRDKAAEVHAFIEGPQAFSSFTEIFDRTVMFNPTRSPESLRRGILHNAHRLPDGTWEWNYDRGLTAGAESPVLAAGPDVEADSMGQERGGAAPLETVISELWEDVSAVRVGLTLVRGGASPVVDDDDVAELLRRQPNAEVVVVEGAGHSIQGDRPIELARLLAERIS